MKLIFTAKERGKLLLFHVWPFGLWFSYCQQQVCARPACPRYKLDLDLMWMCLPGCSVEATLALFFLPARWLQEDRSDLVWHFVQCQACDWIRATSVLWVVRFGGKSKFKKKNKKICHALVQKWIVFSNSGCSSQCGPADSRCGAGRVESSLQQSKKRSREPAGWKCPKLALQPTEAWLGWYCVSGALVTWQHPSYSWFQYLPRLQHLLRGELSDVRGAPGEAFVPLSLW